ncbi:MAG: T9SS type A sorting domain-containing protein [Ignavibacteria bacterium]|nr:T9SS type A sorting domain-containing protein [Ignavibacteria bacterium]
MKQFILLAAAIVFAFSSNGYSQWTYCDGSLQMSGLGSYPYISVLNQNTAWVCGGTGGVPKIYRTTNGGVNFTDVTGSLTGPEFYSIWVVDANTCLVGDGGAVGGTGGNAKIWRTTDGGTSWNTVLTTGGTAGFWNGIAGSPTNRSFVYAQSDAGTTNGPQIVATSTNGGANWTTATTTVGGSTGAAGSIFVCSNQVYGHGISNFNRVCFTTNGGSSFVQGQLTAAGNFTSGFAMNSDASVIVAATSTSLPSINRSTTNGSTWTTQGVTGTISGVCIMKWIPGTNVIYLTGLTGTNAIRKSIDGGLTWSTMTISTLTGWTGMDLVFQGGIIYGYAVAGANTSNVIKLIDNTNTGLDPGNLSIPNEYVLQQNFPNPFNPSTTIKYSVPTAGLVTLKIYNSLGAEVKTVVNSHLAVGNYIETLDMSSLSSGTYFYTLTAGYFKETKKMMLIK